MKTIFVLALLAVAATSAIAQLDMATGYGYGGEGGYHEQWRVQMEPCREFLRQQCSPVALPLLRSRMWQASSCQAMRLRCCRQLAQVPEQSRCQAISGVACQLALCGPQQQQAQLEVALQTIPAMCSVYVPLAPYCSAAAAATCAGGAC